MFLQVSNFIVHNLPILQLITFVPDVNEIYSDFNEKYRCCTYY